MKKLFTVLFFLFSALTLSSSKSWAACEAEAQALQAAQAQLNNAQTAEQAAQAELNTANNSDAQANRAVQNAQGVLDAAVANLNAVAGGLGATGKATGDKAVFGKQSGSGQSFLDNQGYRAAKQAWQNARQGVAAAQQNQANAAAAVAAAQQNQANAAAAVAAAQGGVGAAQNVLAACNEAEKRRKKAEDDFWAQQKAMRENEEIERREQDRKTWDVTPPEEKAKYKDFDDYMRQQRKKKEEELRKQKSTDSIETGRSGDAFERFLAFPFETAGGIVTEVGRILGNDPQRVVREQERGLQKGYEEYASLASSKKAEDIQAQSGGSSSSGQGGGGGGDNKLTPG